MIVAERKNVNEILDMIRSFQKLLIVGCGTCVTVCMAGGEKEVRELALLIKIAREKEKNPIHIDELTVERQCEWEFLDEFADKLKDVDAVLSMACGVGVQAIAERFPDVLVYPGLNTKFMGLPQEQGIWVERCAGCGNCVLDKTGGVCPIARCSKSMLNGPCGGSQYGKCEIDPDIDCGWQLIYDRLKTLGKLHLLEEILPVKDWQTARDGGPRKVVREDVLL